MSIEITGCIDQRIKMGNNKAFQSDDGRVRRVKKAALIHKYTHFFVLVG